MSLWLKLLIGITCLLFGAAGALAEGPSPQPTSTQPTSTATVKAIPWQPPQMLKAGDLVRLGDTPEVCGVIQFLEPKRIFTLKPNKPPILGVFCWATTPAGTPVPNSHVNMMIGWKGMTAPGFTQWKGTTGFEMTRFSPFYQPGLADSQKWPKVWYTPQPSRDQIKGRSIGTVTTREFQIQQIQVRCKYLPPDEGDPKAVVICDNSDLGKRSKTAPWPYILQFQEPWGPRDFTIYYFDPVCKCGKDRFTP